LLGCQWKRHREQTRHDAGAVTAVCNKTRVGYIGTESVGCVCPSLRTLLVVRLPSSPHLTSNVNVQMSGRNFRLAFRSSVSVTVTKRKMVNRSRIRGDSVVKTDTSATMLLHFGCARNILTVVDRCRNTSIKDLAALRRLDCAWLE